MSEISITRFQPAVVTKEKVKSVGAVENDLDAHADSQEQQARQDGQSEHPPRERPAKQVSSPGARRAEATDDDEEILEQAVSRLNAYVQTVKRDLVFDIDPDSQEPSVTVVDRESKQVLRQFNSKEALELAQKLESQEPLSLFKTQV
ncbi:MAG: flagellar biosynthesis protein FlaG [Gammaproteobacteria bacterium]|nr:flagellar biosynthesis protein FlaG [Gammaproteobacteria bacterium]